MRWQFNSGFPAHAGATEGQIPNNELILMEASIKPVSLKIQSSVESVQGLNDIYRCTVCRPFHSLCIGWLGTKFYVIFTLV